MSGDSGFSPSGNRPVSLYRDMAEGFDAKSLSWVEVAMANFGER